MMRVFAVAFALWSVVARAETQVTVSPLTLLEVGKVAGCGLSSSANMPEASAVGEVIAFREGDVTAFAVRARTSPEAGTVTGVRLTTASYDTAAIFPAPQLLPGGIIETRKILERFAGSSFAQELMVMGGRFEITFGHGQPLAYDLPRPMPHNVRQAYLNCAGDLFRPEDEGR